VELKFKRGFVPHYTAAFVWAKVYTADFAWAFSLILTQFLCTATVHLFCLIHCYQECGPILTALPIVIIVVKIWILLLNNDECRGVQDPTGTTRLWLLPCIPSGVINAAAAAIQTLPQNWTRNIFAPPRSGSVENGRLGLTLSILRTHSGTLNMYTTSSSAPIAWPLNV